MKSHRAAAVVLWPRELSVIIINRALLVQYKSTFRH